MMGLYAAEMFKLRQRRMTWILAGLLVMFIVLFYFLLLFAVSQAQTAGPDAPPLEGFASMLMPRGVASFGYSVVFQLGALMGIILTGSAVGSEFAWRTVVTVTAWSGNRVKIVLAKLAALATFAAAGVILGFLTCLLASVVAAATLRQGIGSDIDAQFLLAVFAGGARTWFVIVIYMLLTASLAYLGRSTTLGISVGLAMLFLESVAVTVITVLNSNVAWVKDVLISTNADAVMRANGAVRGLGEVATTGPSPWQGAAVLAVYGILFIAYSLFSFVRRDITE